ncbi:hypothetical protein H2198_007558 [Neophaeococcomyces mojaviensis]|uniref:Uncharacterized protein n=1 Tax=Neophaeococcomyces mojaviensis TaxID=3383035 RepID=A0ACC2ZZZ1_9EURO|nr:hypothetical protein H2198_007558 [Knufia sp. JES_112]
MICRPHLPATPFLAPIPLCRPSVICNASIYRTRSALSHLPPRLRLPQRLQWRFFSHSNLLCEKSHYETLGVPPTATRAELKKKFYSLSKETHPDVNPNNPQAGERFAEVSEAYATLINEDKRRKYDRDVMPRFNRSASRSSGANRSGTYAGSRPATGLSKRRGAFRGPPPSFYSQSGASRNPSAEEQTRRDQEAWAAGAQAGQFDASQYASAGQWDPIFNPTPVYKTQSAEDTRRQHRRAAEMAAAQAFAAEEGQFWAKFAVVSAIVTVGVVIGTMVHRMSATPRGGLTKGDGSRRRIGDGAEK